MMRIILKTFTQVTLSVNLLLLYSNSIFEIRGFGDLVGKWMYANPIVFEKELLQRHHDYFTRLENDGKLRSQFEWRNYHRAKHREVMGLVDPL